MTQIRKYTIDAGNEIDYVSTNIVDFKLLIITYQCDNMFCSKIIKLDKDETSFRGSYISNKHKTLSFATNYDQSTSSKNNNIDCYFDTLI